MSWALLQQLEWRAPLWWLLAAMPALSALLARWRRRHWAAYADPQLRPWALRQAGHRSRRHWRDHAPWLLWALLACAMAGPRLALDAGPGAAHDGRASHDIDLMVVLDVSGSMAAADIAPSRLARAKLKLQDLLARLHGERLGLIAYAGEAGLVLPLTRDRDAFRDALSLADDALFEEHGTHLAAALDLARRDLDDAKRTRAVLLITDAEASSLSGTSGATALAAARRLNDARIPLSVWVMASAEGATLGEDNVPSRPDVSGYQVLVAGRGAVVPVRDGDADLAALYDRDLLALPASSHRQDTTRRWRELYAYPLVPALLLLCALQLRPRRRALLAAVLAVSGSAQADDEAWRAAYQSYAQGQYLVAQNLYRALSGFDARMGEGAAAYRRHDYAYAGQQFGQALLQARAPAQRADALFNLGNSLYYAGNAPAAADAFEGVLRFRPNDTRAKQNLARARGRLMLRNSTVPAQDGVVGRKGRGLSDGPGDEDQPMSILPDKDEVRPLVGTDTQETERAKRTGDPSRATPQQIAANRRAALKKLDLLRDGRHAAYRLWLKQDATREPPAEMAPW